MKQKPPNKKHSSKQLPSDPTPPGRWHYFGRLRHLHSIIIVLFVLSGILLFTGSQLLNSSSAKNRIREAVTSQSGGQFDFQTIHLSFFPKPAIKLNKVNLTIPDSLTADLATLRIVPKIIPLFTGTFRPSLLKFENPQILFTLPALEENKNSSQIASPDLAGKKLFQNINSIAKRFNDLEVQVDRARVTIIHSGQPLLDVKELDLQMGVTQPLPQETRFEMQAVCSQLEFSRIGHKASIKDLSLHSSGQLDRDELSLTIEQLKTAAESSGEISGTLKFSRNPRQEAAAVTLNFSGTDIDVESTRKTVLALLGDISPVKGIFDYLRGGDVARIDFSSQGRQAEHLGDLDNIIITGQLQNGKISIPPIKLDLTEVSGDVTIEKGILKGSGLSARLENSTGRDGSLEIGLSHDIDLFKLELDLDADLARTQDILQELVDLPSFKTEINRFTGLQGTAQGKLILGDRLTEINTEVEVRNFQLQSNYQRLPWPITITEGQFSFNQDQMSFAKLRGTLGQSSFRDLSWKIFFENELSVKISSGKALLDMDEFYPWLKSQESIAASLATIPNVTGKLNLSKMSFSGATPRQKERTFLFKGETDKLSIDTVLFPQTIHLRGGTFTVTPKELTLNKTRINSLNTTIDADGTVQHFTKKPGPVNLVLNGSLGAHSIKWLSDSLQIPESYTIRTPLTLSQAQLSWQPSSPLTFSGQISFKDGPEITTDLNYLPLTRKPQIKQLKIKDTYSDFTLQFTQKPKQNHLSLAGFLQQNSLDNLFVKSPIQINSLEGDFDVIVSKRGPGLAKGHLTGELFSIPLPGEAGGNVFNLEQFTVKGEGQQLKMSASGLKWNRWQWNPVRATFTINDGTTDIQLSEARLCGIDFPGQLFIREDALSLDITPTANNLDLSKSYSCLTEDQVKLTGSLDLASHITGQIPLNNLRGLTNHLKGPIAATLREGVIEQDKVLSRTLEVINFTEIVKGRLPNLSSSGFPYKTITLQGILDEGQLLIENFFMDGETLDLVGNGRVHLNEKRVDAQLLAAPLKTVDTMVKFIPGVNYILAGNLVTIPVSITGPLDDPKITLLSASRVGTGLLRLAERTIKSPFKLLETLIPWRQKNKK